MGILSINNEAFIHLSKERDSKKKETATKVFSCEFSDIFKSTFFQNTSGQLLLNFTNENKASENEISSRWFYYSKVSYTNHIA